MSWFEKLITPIIRTEGKSKGSIPEGLWSKCDNCQSVLYKAELERNLNVCPKCDYHKRLTGRQRLDAFFDADSTTEIAANLRTLDPLKFKDSKKYKDRHSAISVVESASKKASKR